MACQRITSSCAKQFLSRFSTILFDCDGVLWNAQDVIPGAVDFVKNLKDMGKQLMFVTNNSTKTRLEYLAKFKKYGFDVNVDDVYCTAYLAAVYVKNVLKLPESKKTYIVAGSGVAGEFNAMDLKFIGPGPLPDNLERGIHLQFDLEKDPDVGAVVVAYDEHFNLHKIAQSMQYLLDENIPFIATNTDSRFPMGGGVFTPGTGCIVSAIQTAANRDPIVLGKPEKMMFECIQAVHNVDPATTLMVGDRLETDMLFGKNCGLSTLCVLSGVTDEPLLEKMQQSGNFKLLPDHVVESVGHLLT